MSGLTAEERELLAAADDKKPRKRKTEDAPVAAPVAAPAPPRGPFTPVQYDDDGWGDTPVQMRG